MIGAVTLAAPGRTERIRIRIAFNETFGKTIPANNARHNMRPTDEIPNWY